ncbi:hypothetical protein N7499_002042 [Penicillium canescens]|nr:hypothetical protein N7499_002042 [Penicillium canescens]KAJ6165656.1 hypothetical protein N7485_008900 [Penicillium canescens]
MAAIRKTSESTYIFLDIKDNTLDDIANSCHWNENSGFHLPRYGLGALDKLPLEIIHLALIQLDMRSLADFRHVNKSARLVTDSIPQYKRILVHAPASIQGCLNIETARFFSCQDLYEKLSTAECDSCGDFGGYLYLVTCRRVCLLCFTQEADYLPLSRNDAIRKFGLGSKDLACLPRMKSLPGHYSPRGIKRRQRETLFDFSAARQAGIAVHGSLSSMENYASKMASRRLQAYDSRLTERIYGRPGLKMRLMGIALIPGASWALFVLHSSVLERYLQTGVSIASLARPITMVDRFIGVENIRWTVSRIMFQNVER